MSKKDVFIKRQTTCNHLKQRKNVTNYHNVIRIERFDCIVSFEFE